MALTPQRSSRTGCRSWPRRALRARAARLPACAAPARTQDSTHGATHEGSYRIHTECRPTAPARCPQWWRPAQSPCRSGRAASSRRGQTPAGAGARGCPSSRCERVGCERAGVNARARPPAAWAGPSTLILHSTLPGRSKPASIRGPASAASIGSAPRTATSAASSSAAASASSFLGGMPARLQRGSRGQPRRGGMHQTPRTLAPSL